MYTEEEKLRRQRVMDVFQDWLAVLRAALGLTQSEMAHYIGVSRQLYSALELKKTALKWDQFLALFFFFMVNERSKKILKSRDTFTREVTDLLTIKESRDNG